MKSKKYKFKYLIIVILSLFIIIGCTRSYEGDVEYGLDLVKDMEFALQLAKDKNPTYEKRMKKAQNEIFEFLAEMREKYSDEDYQNIERKLQKKMESVYTKAMSGY